MHDSYIAYLSLSEPVQLMDVLAAVNSPCISATVDRRKDLYTLRREQLYVIERVYPPVNTTVVFSGFSTDANASWTIDSAALSP